VVRDVEEGACCHGKHTEGEKARYFFRKRQKRAEQEHRRSDTNLRSVWYTRENDIRKGRRPILGTRVTRAATIIQWKKSNVA
jgi:hypothetical protein